MSLEHTFFKIKFGATAPSGPGPPHHEISRSIYIFFFTAVGLTPGGSTFNRKVVIGLCCRKTVFFCCRHFY
jgi:hypothetical protein